MRFQSPSHTLWALVTSTEPRRSGRTARAAKFAGSVWLWITEGAWRLSWRRRPVRIRGVYSPRSIPRWDHGIPIWSSCSVRPEGGIREITETSQPSRSMWRHSSTTWVSAPP